MQNGEKRLVTTDMVELYMDYLKGEEKSNATLEKYGRDIEKLKVFAQGKVITKELVILFKESLKERYEASSVNSILASMGSFFAFQSWDDCRVKWLNIQHKVFCDQTKELTCITHVDEVLKKRIHAISVAEFKGIDGLPALYLELANFRGIS